MDDILELAERLLEALNEEDNAPFLALCASEASIDYPAHGRLPYGGTWSGQAGIEALLEAHDGAEQILAFDVDQMAPAGDTVFVLGRFEGRARDTGRTWSTPFVHVLQFNDGLLMRWQAHFDTAAAVEAHSGT